MLRPAILYKEALGRCFAIASTDASNTYYTETYWSLSSNNLKDSTWDAHQFVSVDKHDNIIGYFSVSVDRGCHYAHGLAAIRFEKDPKYGITFGKDFRDFFKALFYTYKYQKLNFTICIGSPYEEMYDRFCKKYGGRIIGIRKRQWRLQDGSIHDLKLYELLREDFVANVKE